MTRGDCLASMAVFDWALRNGFLGKGEYELLRALVKRAAWRVGRCVGKDPLATFELAKKIANRERNRDRNCYVYHCTNCHKFHVGTQSKEFNSQLKGFKHRRREEVLEDA